uniref:B30.2/SPRY domain-containing protein n=1 Tax=Gallus gallus TaxID=9031 RepID=A5HUK7_CHICK|nr:hypothetical protein [Gallus gallus]
MHFSLFHLEGSDTELEECDTEDEERDRKISDVDTKLTKLSAEIRKLTAELGERHTKIGELTAEVGDYNRKLRRLTELLEDRDSDVREQDILIRKLSEELEELRGREVEKRERRIDELTAELEHYKAKARRCFEEHRRGEEKLVNVTLDPETAHPRLVLSEDQKSVRWEYSLQESPDGPERFDADPCVLGCETFTSGRHCWVVDLTEGQYCAVGVSRESLPRKGAVSFNPDEGIWAVQQWGFKNRALTSPPTPLNLPRVPKKIRISLDYEWGEVAFFDVENQMPIFTFPLTSFGGERLRPWFWVELGSLSLPR